MTLTEFAKKLREDFEFKYLTVCPYYGEDDDGYVGDLVQLWDREPYYDDCCGAWFCNEDDGFKINKIYPKVQFLMKDSTLSVDYAASHMDQELMFENRDFSPYAECIVEVDE